jgi:3,4-dihydroxy 2-butanone 4-phosphate synthase/GTP cyclohydrolase II
MKKSVEQLLKIRMTTEDLNERKREKFLQVIDDIQKGKPVIVVDDYDREFEGDIVLSAEKATAENLIFCMRHAKGLMCIPMLQETCDRLEIPMMNSNHNDTFETPFTVSIDGIEGCTTGMSVYDRLKTISIVVDDNSSPGELAQPGHMFPLRAKPGLLEERRGHTEASVQLMQAANLKPLAIIVEIMNEVGTMIKGDDLHQFAKIYNLNIISVQEIYDAVYK